MEWLDKETRTLQVDNNDAGRGSDDPGSAKLNHQFPWCTTNDDNLPRPADYLPR